MSAKDVICHALAAGKTHTEIHELLKISHPNSKAAQSERSCQQQVAWYKSQLKRGRLGGPTGNQIHSESHQNLEQPRKTLKFDGETGLADLLRANATQAAATSVKSSFYAQLVEHIFISELLQEAWFGFGQTVEVLRSEEDSSGYDVVFECNGILRYVQLKTSESSARRQSVNVNIGLSTKPGGCVVWLFREQDAATRRIKLSYLYFGGGIDEMLPDLSRFAFGKHTKGDSTGKKNVRPSIRLVPKSKFTRLPTIRELVARLFGLSDGGHV